MIPVDQTTFAPVGNCLSACVASLLEMPIEMVPTFLGNSSNSQHVKLSHWLNQRGYNLTLNQFFPPHPNEYWIAGGPSARGVSHVVVMQGYKMVHDPHPSRAGILNITHRLNIIRQ